MLDALAKRDCDAAASARSQLAHCITRHGKLCTAQQDARSDAEKLCGYLRRQQQRASASALGDRMNYE